MSRRKAVRGFEIKAAHTPNPWTVLDAHVCDVHRDIVLNGYGIKKTDAKKLRDWLTKAMRYAK